MTLPKPDLIILIDRLIETYRKRHDNSDFMNPSSMCEEMLLYLADIKKLAEKLLTQTTEGDAK
ncbi:hypothetical protein [Nitrososphaeria virus YSH_922147]|uniref:Uncharacterized protein n=1 Tax=Nitrososphaeria virus YSH_922147 TaxID=3071323 RepID=A0A976YF46_9CAUD|nr:hypothetical protein QKV94_gp02 [Yangshan Harbor Nitrososphaeria virus]UVF62411.1 hypothetical protein [Nitrososphaeria virus YSH_922147]